jgi:lysozyme
MSMNNENLQKLIAELRRDEGVRYVKYKDSKNIDTTGVGHNLEAEPLPAGWKFPLNDTQVNSLLDDDLQDVFHDLDRNLPWWTELSDVRMRVLANLCFNMGINRLLGFKKALIAMRQGKFSIAADEMLDSKWAREDVGIGTPAKPGRALRLANMMRTGVV